MSDIEQGKYGFDFELDDFQKEAAEHISNGKSVVVCAPTGAGKTVIAEHAIIKSTGTKQKSFLYNSFKSLKQPETQ